jgi:hypothetical protein
MRRREFNHPGEVFAKFLYVKGVKSPPRGSCAGRQAGGGAQMHLFLYTAHINPPRKRRGRGRARGGGRETTKDTSRIDEIQTHTNRFKRRNRARLPILSIDTALGGTEGRG